MRGPRTTPVPPRPDLERRPTGSFGWLDARLLHEGWLARLGPEATAVLVLLALAADRRGASYYGREKMGCMTGMERRDVDRALETLRTAGLVDQRPWRHGHPDGVWQLLPLPTTRSVRDGETSSIASILADIGVTNRAPAASLRVPGHREHPFRSNVNTDSGRS